MKKRKILERLISDYKTIISTVERIKESKKIHEYLESIFADCGVCKYAGANGIANLYDAPWIRTYRTEGNMWAERPRDFSNKKDILRLLNVRLTNLKTELSES